MGDDLDNRSLPGIKIDVIMGRNAGFLTAATALGKQRDDDGPHLLYIPERRVSMDKFLSDVEGVYKKLGRCVVAVSEGICDTDGVTWAEKIAKAAGTGCARQYPAFRHGCAGGFFSCSGKSQARSQASPSRYVRVSAEKFCRSAVIEWMPKRHGSAGRTAVKYAMKEKSTAR